MLRVASTRHRVCVCVLFAALSANGGAVVAQQQQAAPSPDLAALPGVSIQYDARHERLTIEFPPEDLPAAAGMMYMRSLRPHIAIIPVAGTIYSLRTQVVDSTGRILPHALLHHVNLTDPTRRELFLPISLHVFAASKETPPVDIPRLILGLPLERGQRLLLTAMLANSSRTAYPGVRIRVVLGYRAAGRVFPLLRAFPWVMDAMFPLGSGPGGSKAFDLPPGRSVKSWQSSPAIPGYVLGVGGHVHDYAVSVDLTDVSTNQVLWHGVPQRDSAGRVLWLPVTRFYNWHSLGVHIMPTHFYRISVTYENPTGHVLHEGGMGAVAGLFVPDRGAQWPQVDTTSALYRQDLAATFMPDTATMAGMAEEQ